MLTKILVNQDRTEAVLYYTDRQPFTLSHDQGLVLDLVAYFLSPISHSEITWTAYIGSTEDTAIIELDKVS